MADGEAPDDGGVGAASVDYGELALTTLKAIAENDELPATARVAAAKVLLDRTQGRGRPPGDDEPTAVEITVRFVDPSPGAELEA